MNELSIRTTAVEIFAQLCEVRPSAVREFVLQMSKTQQDDVRNCYIIYMNVDTCRYVIYELGVYIIENIYSSCMLKLLKQTRFLFGLLYLGHDVAESNNLSNDM